MAEENFMQRQSRVYGGGGGGGGYAPPRRRQQMQMQQAPQEMQQAPAAPPPRRQLPVGGPQQGGFAALGGAQQGGGATAASGANQLQALGGAPRQVSEPTAQAPPPQAAAGPAAAGPTAEQQQQGNDFNAWATQTFGRGATAEEGAQIRAAAGAPLGPNGTYTPEQIAQSKSWTENAARARGWQGPAGAPAAGAPAAAGPAQPAFGANPAEGAPGHQGRVAVQPRESTPLSPYQQENTGTVGAQGTDLMQRMLANPESLPPAVVEQMKAASKQSASSQAEQLRGQASANLAGRGFSSGGGMQTSADSAVDQNFLDTLLNANRDTDINAAQTNFNDRLKTSQAGTDFMNAATNRSTANSGAEVQRWQANDNAQSRNDQFKSDQMQKDRSASFNEYLGKNGVDLDNAKFNEQKDQFKKTFGFDMARFVEDSRRNNRDFGEGQRQYNGNTGLATSKVQVDANNAMMSWIERNMPR